MIQFPSVSLFTPDVLKKGCAGIPSAVYIGSPHDEAMQAFMEERYHSIFSILLERHSIPFYYLPISLKEGHLKDCLSYNNPALTFADDEVVAATEKFTNLLCAINSLPTGSKGMALMDYNNPVKVVDFFSFDESSSIPDELNRWVAHLVEVIRIEIFRNGSLDMSCGKLFKQEGEELFICRPIPHNIHFSLDASTRPADEEFEREGIRLTEEIRERMNVLKERGFMKLLAQLVEEMRQELPAATPSALSRLYIDKEYRIFLTDWENREVVMTPLPKAIFLLFLNHPEGILFKELIDYQREILETYKAITQREDYNAIRGSIRSLTDPMSNSINEKCSRIRNAFLSLVSEELASAYYVTGKRGEAKRITLDRKLVTREE